MSKDQEASSILRVGSTLSKSAHFNRAYLVTVCIVLLLPVGYAQKATQRYIDEMKLFDAHQFFSF